MSTSNYVIILGTIFLWIFWPSINSALATGAEQQRAVYNTYFALAASTGASFVISSLLDRQGKYHMVTIAYHLRNKIQYYKFY